MSTERINSTDSAALARAEDLARRFHEEYERLAPHFGYETRKESAVAWEHVPEKNRALMIAVCSEIVTMMELKLAERVDRLEDANRKIGKQLLDHSEEVNHRGDRISTLEAQNKELVEALRPFARYAERVIAIGYGDSCPITPEPSDSADNDDITIAHLKQAHAALASPEPARKNDFGEDRSATDSLGEATSIPASDQAAASRGNCSACGGTGIAGYVGGDDDEVEACFKCHGTGRAEAARKEGE